MEMLFDEEKTPYVMVGGQKIQLEVMPATEKFYTEKAESELREIPEVVEQGLKELRELLRGETSLNVPLDDDDYLIKFLRPCKFYAKSAFQRIRQYYEFRRSHPTYCRELVPTKVRAAFEHGIVSMLAPRDAQGRRILLVEAGEKWVPRDVSLAEMFRGIQLSLEAAMVEPRTQICGVVVLCDMKGLSFSQVMQFTPSFAKMVVDWIQDCIPIRLKGVHVVNQPYIFNMLFAIFKPFLREKLRSRIHFHGSDQQSLLKHVDARALRARHGGDMPGPDLPPHLMWKMIAHYEDQFQLANSFGYTEKTKK